MATTGTISSLFRWVEVMELRGSYPCFPLLDAMTMKQ